MVGNYKVTD